MVQLCPFNLHRTSPKNLHGVGRRCAGTLTFNEGNIHGRTSWVCIHPYSATSMAIHGGCVFTHILLWRQHPWPYVVSVHSPILCCEGNICGRTSWVCIHPYSPILCCEGNIRGHTLWVCIHPYSVVKATSVAIHRGCAFSKDLPILWWKQ